MKKYWKIGIVNDTTLESKGDHGTHLAFSGLPGVEQVLADPNCDGFESRLKKIGAKKHYKDYRTMIMEETPDIISVCSRLPGDHFEVIKAAAEHGCHVLCEKPLTASLEKADLIVSLAEKHRIKIAVAHLARYSLVFRSLKKLLKKGEIGQPLTFYGRGKEDERGGGEDMTVLGTHIFDLAIFLLGKPEYVFADVRIGNRPITQHDRSETSEPIGACAGDSIWANFKFSNEVNGIFESRKGLYQDKVRMGITVVGTEGSLSVRYDNERKLRICRSPIPAEDEIHYEELSLLEDRIIPAGAIPIDYKNYIPPPAKYFADANRFAALDLMQAIEENRQPEASVYDAVNVLEMIYGVYASSLERKAVDFPLTNRKHSLGE